MPMREFADSLGQVWQAWDTHPKGVGHLSKGESAFTRFVANTAKREGREPTTVRDQYAAGWLTFKLANDRRRLTPIPDGWELADDATLQRYLGSASDAPEVPLPGRTFPKA
ncbi:MAG TPA: hypothetical protein VIM36_04285 [Gemmatimonadaceae bacterium]|jgi:hypothetical protein